MTRNDHGDNYNNTHWTAAGPSKPWGWTLSPGTLASRAAYAASNGPSQPPPPPETAAEPAGQRPCWSPPPAATGYDRSREDWELEEAPPPASSGPPGEPRNRSPEHLSTEAETREDQTWLQSLHQTLQSSLSQRFTQSSPLRIRFGSQLGVKHERPPPRPDTKWKALKM